MSVLPLLVAACLSGSGRSDSTLFPRRRTLHRRSLIQQDMSMPNLLEQQSMSMPLEQLSMTWEQESMPLEQFEMITENDFVCMTADQCKEKFISLKQEDGTKWKGFFYSGNYPTKGCFAKGDNGNLYFGTGGSREQMATRDVEMSSEQRERIWCDQKEMRDILVTPSPVPGTGSLFGEIADVVITSLPTLKPTMSPLQSIAMWNGIPLIISPDTTNDPSNQPTPKPITPQPSITDSPVSKDPSNQPTPKPITPQPIITDSPVSNFDVLEENSDFQWKLDNDETGGFDMFDVDWDVVAQEVAGAMGSKGRKTSSPTTNTLSSKSSKSVESTKTSSPTTDSLVTDSPTDVFSSTKSSKRNSDTALLDNIMEVNSDMAWDLNGEEIAGALDIDGEVADIHSSSGDIAGKSSKTNAPTRDGDQVVCALGSKCSKLQTSSPTTDTLSSKSSKSVKSTKTSSPTTDSLVTDSPTDVLSSTKSSKSKKGKMSKTSAPTDTPTMRGDPIVAQGAFGNVGEDNSDMAWDLDEEEIAGALDFDGEVADTHSSSGDTAGKSSKTNAPTRDGDQVVCALGINKCGKTSSPTTDTLRSKSSKSVKSTKTSSPTTDSLVTDSPTDVLSSTKSSKSKKGKMSKTSAPTDTPTMRGDPIVAQEGNVEGMGAPDDSIKSSKSVKSTKTSPPTISKSSNSKSSKSVVVTPDDINSILSSNEEEQTDNSYMWATVGILVAGVVLLIAAAFTKNRSAASF